MPVSRRVSYRDTYLDITLPIAVLMPTCLIILIIGIFDVSRHWTLLVGAVAVGVALSGST